MSFNTVKLAGARVLVTGDLPEQHIILDSSEWDDVKLHSAFQQADALFNEKVKEFFQPISDAADAAHALVEALENKDDPAFYINVEAGTEHIEGSPAVTVRLSRESVILRMLEEGDTSRLIWVGSSLEIIAL